MTQLHPSLLYHGPAILVVSNRISALELHGIARDVTPHEARRIFTTSDAPIVLNGRVTARRLGLQSSTTPHKWRDVFELFLLLYPTRSVAPTLQGIREALDLAVSETPDATDLLKIAERLHRDLTQKRFERRQTQLRGLMQVLDRCQWSWRKDFRHLAEDIPPDTNDPLNAIRVWRRLPKWEDSAPLPQPTARPVARADALRQLSRIIGSDSESRPAQRDFASVACAAFQPREAPGMPDLILAEAGTGTGKTAGYLAPATVWATENSGTVWVSTYTRHLQRQIERELHTLFPNRVERRRKVVIRKGRENYLCLLNYEDAVNVFASRPEDEAHALTGILLAFVARWAEETEDGDLIGGDLPGWFFDFYDRATLLSLADRRGECIYSACPHYQSCFVEHSVRRAASADIVIANHALVMAQSAWALQDEAIESEDEAPLTHYIFDEGHHVADAADSAFSVALSGLEASELRRWLLGAEGARSRARGMRRRLDDLILQDVALERCLTAMVSAAQALPSSGWLDRLRETPDTEPLPADIGTLDLQENPSEKFLRSLHGQLRARTERLRPHDTAECDLFPADENLKVHAGILLDALLNLRKPLSQIVTLLTARLNEVEISEEPNQFQRIDAAARTIKRRAINRLDAWIDLLRSLGDGPDSRFIDIIRRDAITHLRFSSTRFDVGIHRHWKDPTVPFATVMQGVAHGLLVTSATLRDQPGKTHEHVESGAIAPKAQKDASGVTPLLQNDENIVDTVWRAAEQMVGATHFLKPALRAAMMSPFDYRHQTRAFIVTDVSHRDISQLAAAFLTLFQASGGGALGLFTAISRLKLTHKALAPLLDAVNIPLYAQHVDQLDNATLVDIFRTEVKSCLLGTDAMRDGIDIKGRALHLVVFEKTPWPRPDILHRERRRHAQAEGMSDYDDRTTRMRIRQAFGRLIRASSDRGVFVMLDKQFPSRLLSAFPEGVMVERLSLSEVASNIRTFLNTE